jgi:hypothetical protein
VWYGQFADVVALPGWDPATGAVGPFTHDPVLSYYTRDFSPTPTADDPSCARAFLDTNDPACPASAPVYLDLQPVCIDYALSTSTDGFTTETRVPTQSSNPYVQFAGSFIGDYSGVAVDSNGNAVAVWTDGRGNPRVATSAASTTPNQDTVVASGLESTSPSTANSSPERALAPDRVTE